MAFRIESRLRWSVRPCLPAAGVIISCALHGFSIDKIVPYDLAERARFNLVWLKCLRMQEDVIREYEAPALAKGLREWPLWMLEREQDNV